MSRKKLILLIGLLATVPYSANADEIQLTTDTWCPYACAPSSDLRGILVDVAKIILEKAGHTVVYKEMNWARAILKVRNGTFDGLVGAYKSDAPDFVFPQESIMISKMCFFVKEDDPWRFKEYDTLKGRKILVINDYSYGDKFDVYIQKNLDQGDQTIQNLTGTDLAQRRVRLMMAGRVDTILEDWLVLPFQVKPLQQMKEFQPIKEFKNAGCLPEEELYIAFSPNKASSHNYAALISSGVREMKASGELAKIINKYR